jgi:hypothetical protein
MKIGNKVKYTVFDVSIDVSADVWEKYKGKIDCVGRITNVICGSYEDGFDVQFDDGTILFLFEDEIELVEDEQPLT